MIPVICTSKIKPELINEFLVEAYDGYPEASQSLVLITTKGWSYYNNDETESAELRTHGGGPMKVPSRPPWTSDFVSPYLDHTPEEVAEALQKAKDAPGYLQRDYCAILDKQTVEDRTVLIIKTRRSAGDNLPPSYEDSPIVHVRESFKEANGLLQSASVGVSSLAGTTWNHCMSRK